MKEKTKEMLKEEDVHYLTKTKNLIQSNNISTAIWNCSANTIKIVCFCYSQEIKDGLFQFKITDFLKSMGISTRDYENIKTNLFEIAKSYITFENQYETKKWRRFTILNWFNYVDYDEKSGLVYVKINDLLKPYFENQKKNFSKIELKLIGSLKSTYAIRWYEILKSYEGFKGKKGNKKGEWFYQTNEIEVRKMFKLEKEYEGRENNLIEYVIKQPLKELNLKNKEFQVEFKKVKVDGEKIYTFHCIEIKKLKALEKAKTEAEMNYDEIEEIIKKSDEERNKTPNSKARQDSIDEMEEAKRLYEEHKEEIDKEIASENIPAFSIEITKLVKALKYKK